MKQNQDKTNFCRKLEFSPNHEADRIILLDACKKLGRLPEPGEREAILAGTFRFPESPGIDVLGATAEYIRNHDRRGGRAPIRRSEVRK